MKLTNTDKCECEKHLPEIAIWLAKNGWDIQFPKGNYDVFRATKLNMCFPQIIYMKDGEHQYIAIQECDIPIIEPFFEAKMDEVKRE